MHDDTKFTSSFSSIILSSHAQRAFEAGPGHDKFPEEERDNSIFVSALKQHFNREGSIKESIEVILRTDCGLAGVSLKTKSDCLCLHTTAAGSSSARWPCSDKY